MVSLVKEKGEIIGKILVICVVTRAIHIEIMFKLSYESFLHAIHRLSSRKGYPELTLSNNATRFVIGAVVLKELTDHPLYNFAFVCFCHLPRGYNPQQR